jgi:hypothetical protein
MTEEKMTEEKMTEWERSQNLLRKFRKMLRMIRRYSPKKKKAPPPPEKWSGTSIVLDQQSKEAVD